MPSDVTDYRASLLGDVVFTAAATASITLVVSGPTSYANSESIAAGTWFASPLHLLEWLVAQWNASIPGGQMSVTWVSDPDDANYGKFAVVPETGLGTVTSLTFAIPEVFAACGLASASVDLGAGSSTKYTGAAPSAMTFFWPVALYNRRVDVLSGYSAYAEDGTVYSMEGAHQETHELSFALDRYGGYDEVDAWLGLWLSHWSRGRSVFFALDNNDLGAGVSLVCEAQDRLDFRRLIEQTNSLDYTAAITFRERAGGRVTMEVP